MTGGIRAASRTAAVGFFRAMRAFVPFGPALSILAAVGVQLAVRPRARSARWRCPGSSSGSGWRRA